MDNEKLNRANHLACAILELKRDIKVIENCHGVDSLRFNHGHGSISVDHSGVNFKALQKQVLASLNKKLFDMEKEFAKL